MVAEVCRRVVIAAGIKAQAHLAHTPGGMGGFVVIYGSLAMLLSSSIVTQATAHLKAMVQSLSESVPYSSMDTMIQVWY